jgi:hypothetical protein
MTEARLGCIKRGRLDRMKVEDVSDVLTQLSQLRTFFGFFALIFVVRPCVFIVAL